MFGTVRPFQPELKHRETAQYKAVYCGLCHTLSARYGALSRLLCNYDFVLLAMLYWREPCQTVKRRCVRHPFQKQHVCQGGADYAADALMLFTDWSLRDRIRDEKGVRRLTARLIRRLYRKAFQRAAERLPAEAAVCERKLTELWALEEDKDASLEANAAAFGGALASLAGDNGRAAGSLLEHLGRWIYTIDAFEDLERDRKSGAYNAVAARYGTEIPRDEVGAILGREQDALLNALDLMPEGAFAGIVRNILTLGLHSRGHSALYGEETPEKPGSP
ncbi:MAG: DUF5685 family protein [Oscillospiraceae bacterium]|jgi:hypothetical protein|nr:DUF5685 family protein [Oscillospiraceae bacterium]